MGTEAVPDNWISCPRCEAPCRDRDVPRGREIACRRCGSTVLEHVGKKTLQPAMALSLAGLLALTLANLNPVLQFEVVGRTQSGYIMTGVEELIRQGYLPIALLVAFAGVVAPLFHLFSMFYVSTSCCLGVRLPHVRVFWRMTSLMEPWNLVPVYAIATIVSVVKLRMLGTVEWELGARWVLGVAFLSLCAQQAFQERIVRERLRSLGVAA